ncbi:hypothetical protein GGX14DRAFT_455772 [Mycena pura]|uniref:Uncharacterized protein n=1 Tax=Mycena pura TaxID=153505 RepID=A0AAD6VBP4_9AGAR|nr:hypothetical protein GGX14DRAFT_455772 [Mycena pura]
MPLFSVILTSHLARSFSFAFLSRKRGDARLSWTTACEKRRRDLRQPNNLIVARVLRLIMAIEKKATAGSGMGTGAVGN